MHLVFFEVLPPLPLDFGPARGAGVPLGICLSRAGSLLLLLLLRVVGAREFFFFFFFYEWEYRTGTMCPFSSLHPLKKEKKCNKTIV